MQYGHLKFPSIQKRFRLRKEENPKRGFLNFKLEEEYKIFVFTKERKKKVWNMMNIFDVERTEETLNDF